MVALTLDPCFGGGQNDYSKIAGLFAAEGIPYEIRRTNIGRVVFEVRDEDHPCSLCAKMRRGALHDTAKELGCNKLALGHHRDDAIETFIMNLFNEGRLGCFAPVSYLSRKDLTVIRPLVLAQEKEIKAAVKKENFPIVGSGCRWTATPNGNGSRPGCTRWKRTAGTSSPRSSGPCAGPTSTTGKEEHAMRNAP